MGKKLSRGNLDFEKFSYFENTNFTQTHFGSLGEALVCGNFPF